METIKNEHLVTASGGQQQASCVDVPRNPFDPSQRPGGPTIFNPRPPFGDGGTAGNPLRSGSRWQDLLK
jgi:hypothetical protein